MFSGDNNIVCIYVNTQGIVYNEYSRVIFMLLQFEIQINVRKLNKFSFIPLEHKTNTVYSFNSD